MRALRYLCIAICIIIVFSLCSCENQGSPSEGELDNGGIISTDFDPNFHKPKPPAASGYLNMLTWLENVKEADLTKIPVAVVLKNSADAKTVHSGLTLADIVFEAETENGETALLAVYRSAPAGVTIGPLASGIKIFAEISLGFNWKLASNGIDSEHTDPFLKNYGTQYFNLSEEKFAVQTNNGKGDDLKAYTDGDKLNTAINETGITIDKDNPPIWMFTDSRTAILDSAKKITVKFNDTATTEFYYNETEKFYTRGKDGAPFTDYNTNQTDNYSNIFVLTAPATKYKDCDHINYELAGGEGYYATAGGWEKITWHRSGEASSIYFEDSYGRILNINKGRSYICFVNSSIEDCFKAE